VAGVPAKQIGWVGHAGVRLQEQDGRLHCPASGRVYEQFENTIREVRT
jgi:hypothetical protein